MRQKALATLAVGALFSTQLLKGQEVRRAIPVEPPVAPAVPFDFDRPVPTAAPTPIATPRPRPSPLLTPKPVVIPSPPPPPIIQPSPAATPAAPIIQSQSPDKEQIDYANSFYAKKIYDMAAPEYEKYVGLYPKGADLQMAYFRLAESYRAQGSTNAAKTAYETLLSSFTTGEFVGPSAYRLADINFQEKNYDAALAMFRRAAVRVSDKTVANSAKFYTARCLENLRSPAEARMAYEELVEIRDNNPFREASRLALARILTDEGKKIEAHKQYELLAKESEKPEIRIEALVKAALLKIDLGQDEKAISDLQNALQQSDIGAWKEVAQLGLMHAYYESGKFKPLLDIYTSSPNGFSAEVLPEVLMMAGNANRKLGNYKEARGLYEQVIKNSPDSTFAKEAEYQRLVSLYDANDPLLVAEVDKYVTQEFPPEKKDQALLLKAEALYRKQDYAAATPVYASLNKSSLPVELRADALFKLGWCQMQTKDFANAINSFTAFLDANPQHKLVPSALAQRAGAFQQTQDFPSALKDFDTLISKYPKARERELALQQKALLLGQQQDNRGMSDAFNQLLKEYPQTAVAGQANYWIGVAAYEMKDYKNAVLHLDSARKADMEQYYERATLRILTSELCLEDKEQLAAEVDSCTRNHPKTKIPGEVLRWLGNRFLNDKDNERAEKYLAMLTNGKDQAIGDDWLNLGRSVAAQKRYDEAAKFFAVYLGGVKEPIPRATGLLALGDAQLGLGRFDEAQKSVDEACALQPEGRLNAEGRIMAGEIQMARGNYESASKLFLSVSVLLDDAAITPHALELAIEALKKAGKDAEVAKTLNELQSHYPEYLQRK